MFHEPAEHSMPVAQLAPVEDMPELNWQSIRVLDGIDEASGDVTVAFGQTDRSNTGYTARSSSAIAAGTSTSTSLLAATEAAAPQPPPQSAT